jgi:hypothetical protein
MMSNPNYSATIASILKQGPISFFLLFAGKIAVYMIKRG